MRYNTGNPVEPDGSSDPRDLYDNTKTIDKLVNGPELTWLGRLGKTLKTWAGMEKEFSDLIARSGYESIYVQYEAAAVVDRPTQLVQREGDLYRVTDQASLPLTLTGVWATDAPRLTAVGDASLRAALAEPDGASLVESVFGSLDSAIQTIPVGFEYSSAAKPWGTGSITTYDQLVLNGGTLYKYIGSTLPKSITGSFEAEPANTWIRAGENLSAYVPSATKKEDLTSKITSGYKVVITGDSLPFNAFQFPSSTPLLPADYAYKNPYGLAAWGHMVRDSIYSSANDFTLAKNAHIITSPGIARSANVNNVYTAPFNNQLETFLVYSDQDQIVIRMDDVYVGASVRLMFFTGNDDFSNIASFDIYTGGAIRASVDLRGDDSLYTGRYQLNVDNVPMSGDKEVTITNIKRADGNSGFAAIQIIGYTTNHVDVKMTAHGSWTSGQVLADYENMVGQHDPDLIFYQIGANDMGLGVSPPVFASNVESFIVNSRASKPNCDIVLVSTTPTDAYPNRWGVSRRYIDQLYRLAVKYQLYFIDLYDVFGTVSPDIWRYDNVHTNIRGGNYVYKHVMDLVFPRMSLNKGYVASSEYQVVTGVTQSEQMPNTVTWSFDSSGNPVVSASDKKYIKVETAADGKITLTPSAILRISDAYILVAPPSQYYVARPSSYGFSGSVTYTAINMLNNPPALVTAKVQLAGVFMTVVFG
ncbi:SGNH/GDSL hydrolase family protein [Pseudomonas lactis]|uniref:SGNH/GDSL hydrolase family protein n=1 Tax=Pseudomonas lactis TaxID=1615674 RepID=UPI001474CE2D|nr:SGNH/GDSL hydrolase family protein [Pseudomonas lactis]NNA48625.1 hypothetical protein [Pseudomonas lactis]